MVKTRKFYLVLLMLFFTVISLSGEASSDSKRVAEMADDASFTEGSYAAVAFLYGLLPTGMVQLVVYVVGICFVLVSARGVYTNVHALVVGFLCIAPGTLAIGDFQKDLIVAVFIMLAAATIASERTATTKVLIITTLYLVYAQFFRTYYFLIAASFMGVFFFRRLPLPGKLLMIAIVIVVIFNIPTSFWVELQGSRDTVNMNRLARNGLSGARTAFFNPWPIDGIGAFALNYIYAVLRLNFALLFDQGPKEIFLFLNVITYYSSMFWAYRRGSATARIAATLIIGHVVVLFLFEPDLGSYIRHLSTTLPLLAIILSEYFAIRPWRFVLRSGSERYAKGRRPA